MKHRHRARSSICILSCCASHAPCIARCMHVVQFEIVSHPTGYPMYWSILQKTQGVCQLFWRGCLVSCRDAVSCLSNVINICLIAWSIIFQSTQPSGADAPGWRSALPGRPRDQTRTIYSEPPTWVVSGWVVSLVGIRVWPFSLIIKTHVWIVACQHCHSACEGDNSDVH